MSQSLGWLLLILSGLLDVAWAVSMKLTQGYTRPGWTALSIVLLAAFVYLLGKVLTVLPVGSAYAVWTGIGALGTVLLGVVLFGETVSALRVVGAVLVIAGIAALKQAPA
ncbi:small multidrug resistance protein [Caballeronia pedi]|uniref:Guanidinium exporter n=1 Tax=Caballeronia pedi TaxID=1777141 RepID=A0A158CV74_9BURK|nr:multidrug efflux SMR transporter [Caballeronia pedi]SAK86228.1 small multidrug resistance protein [Caballeronia pedi]